jgi:hypothetical protein
MIKREADGAIVADDRDLGGCAVAQHVHERDDRIGRKVDVVQAVAGLVQDHAERHRRELQMRE